MFSVAVDEGTHLRVLTDVPFKSAQEAQLIATRHTLDAQNGMGYAPDAKGFCVAPWAPAGSIYPRLTGVTVSEPVVAADRMLYAVAEMLSAMQQQMVDQRHYGGWRHETMDRARRASAVLDEMLGVKSEDR